MALKDRILQKFSNHTGEYFSGEELAEEYRVSRAAVWKAVRALKSEGYDIDSQQSRGYCFTDRNDFLREEIIRSAAPEIKYPLYVVDVVDSTNNYAKILCAKNAPHGTLVAANHQTAGRGRRGHSFYSPGNAGLYMSLIIDPAGIKNLSWITPAAAVAAIEAIEETTGIHPKIKWVNDLFVDSRKVAGILTEAITDFESGTVDRIIIGIGINCRKSDFPEEIRNTAGYLPAEHISRSLLAAALWRKLLERCTNPDDPSVKEAYRRDSLVLGREVSYTVSGITYNGTVREINDAGNIVIEKPDGSVEILQSGEISVRL